MGAEKLRSYRFATEDQWNSCVLVQTDRDWHEGIRPVQPFERTGTRFESRGGNAPVVTRAGEVLWRDDDRSLHRLSSCSDDTETFAGSASALGCAKRLVATGTGLWVAGESPNSLQLFEDGSFTRLLSIDISNDRVVDIASGNRSVLALLERNGNYRVTHFAHFGRAGDSIDLTGIGDAMGFVYLRRAKRFVVLTGRHPHLYWFSTDGGSPITSVSIAGLRPCFNARALGSDGRDRLFLGGADGKEFGGGEFVLVFDGDANRLGEIPIDRSDAPLTGITATRSNLFVTGRRGLVRFGASNSVPESAGESSCMMMTPVLDSPDREDKRRWLRVEATAKLPSGCSLEIAWAATADRPAAGTGSSGKKTTTGNELIASALNDPLARTGRTIFHGSGDSTSETESKVFSAGLFDVPDRYMRVCLTLTAAAGARLPVVSELSVLYPGRTLMEHLPAIYKREEERPGSFLRALVGVLEATTQGIDSRIGSMGRRIHPDSAEAPWLDFIARWIGVPWDDGLSTEQKQRIVRRAADLAKARGTREGLEALLESLIPDEPRRFRVTDATADFGFAVVGGRSCVGSSLPAMLGGHTRWRAELDSRAVLGYTRLPCGRREDGASHLTGRISIDVAATAAEREAWSPWLLALIEQMVPLTARVKLRWVTLDSLRTNRLDDELTIESDIDPHLGTDAITARSRLPERGSRLTDTGASFGTRLS